MSPDLKKNTYLSILFIPLIVTFSCIERKDIPKEIIMNKSKPSNVVQLAAKHVRNNDFHKAYDLYSSSWFDEYLEPFKINVDSASEYPIFGLYKEDLKDNKKTSIALIKSQYLSRIRKGTLSKYNVIVERVLIKGNKAVVEYKNEKGASGYSLLVKENKEWKIGYFEDDWLDDDGWDEVEK